MTITFKDLMLGLLVLSSVCNIQANEQAKEEASAETKPEIPTKSTTKSTVEMQQIDTWVGELGHQQLTKRVKAKQSLLKAGKTAIPSLAKAALLDKREDIERSIDILGSLSQSKDEETSDAARVTLKMLSESKNPSTAERAKSVLNTKEADSIKPFEGWDRAGNPFAGGGGGANRSVSVSSMNGVRTIKVVENGKETLIQEVPGRGIRVTTEKEEKPIEIVVKNAADLKKRLPEAFKLYEQYTKNTGVPKGFGQLSGFNFGNGNFGNGNFGIGNPGVNAGGQTFSFNAAVQGSTNQAAVKQLEQLKRRMTGNPAMQRLLDQQIQALSRK